MAVIYMVHPIHGAKVATSDAEADYDEMYGWERIADPAATVEKNPKRRGPRRAEQED